MSDFERLMTRMREQTMAALERSIFWGMLEWTETGEPALVGYQLYWDPFQGFSGDPISVELITEMVNE